MNDAEFEREKARVDALVARWAEPLHLGPDALTFEFFRGPIPDAGDALFFHKTEWEYCRATLSVNVEEAASTPDDDLEFGLLHDLMEIATNPLVRFHAAEQGSDGSMEISEAYHLVKERVASALARYLIDLRASWQPDGKARKRA